MAEFANQPKRLVGEPRLVNLFHQANKCESGAIHLKYDRPRGNPGVCLGRWSSAKVVEHNFLKQPSVVKPDYLNSPIIRVQCEAKHE